MILTGPEIERETGHGSIDISPWRPEHINPASYDLTLGETYRTYVTASGQALDARVENMTRLHGIAKEGLVLEPGELYLMYTAESVWTDRYVPIIDGKSSIGRLGICVHLTAGYGDPGFRGQYTLEVTCVRPVRVYAGMCFCQVRFHAMQGVVKLYRGNYAGPFSRGAVGSRSWAQFNADI
jgi:dCTP deaminase